MADERNPDMAQLPTEDASDPVLSGEKWEDPVLPPDDFSDKQDQDGDDAEDDSQSGESKRGKGGLLIFGLLGALCLGGAGLAYVYFGDSNAQQTLPAPIGEGQITQLANAGNAVAEPVEGSIGLAVPDPTNPSLQPSGMEVSVLVPDAVSPPALPKIDVPSANVQSLTVESGTAEPKQAIASFQEGLPKLPEIPQETAPASLNESAGLANSGDTAVTALAQPSDLPPIQPIIPVEEAVVPLGSAVKPPDVSPVQLQKDEGLPIGSVDQSQTASQASNALAKMQEVESKLLVSPSSQMDAGLQQPVAHGKDPMHPKSDTQAAIDVDPPALKHAAGDKTAKNSTAVNKTKSVSTGKNKAAAKKQPQDKVTPRLDLGNGAVSHAAYRLRSAMPGEAWVSLGEVNALQHIKVGDHLPGIGKIRSIDFSAGEWVVLGTMGSIR
jgi:hypothetical protein